MESLFSFKGRVDIRSFQSFFVAAVVISFFNSFIFQLSRDTNTFWFILGMLVTVAFTAILVIMAVKRLQDIGRNPWEILTLLIPIYNLYLLYILLFEEGDKGENKYGKDPLQTQEKDNSWYFFMQYYLLLMVIIFIVYALINAFL